jgi:hypothetical protein
VISGLTGWLAGPGAVREVRPEFRTFATWCRRIRPAARAFTAFQARGFRADPDGTVRKEAASTGGDDAEVVADSGVLAMLVASAHAVWDRGGEGTYEHSLAMTQPWGFDLADVEAHVEVWHGSDDHEIHPAMAEAAVRLLPDASLHLVEGRGHLLVFAEWGPILESLVPMSMRWLQGRSTLVQGNIDSAERILDADTADRAPVLEILGHEAGRTERLAASTTSASQNESRCRSSSSEAARMRGRSTSTRDQVPYRATISRAARRLSGGSNVRVATA